MSDSELSKVSEKFYVLIGQLIKTKKDAENILKLYRREVEKETEKRARLETIKEVLEMASNSLRIESFCTKLENKIKGLGAEQ